MAEIFTLSSGGARVFVNYNPNNLRIQSAAWDIPVGKTAVMKVWENNILVYDEVHIGPSTGSQNVPGAHSFVEEIDPVFGTILHFPPEVDYIFEVHDS